MLRNKQTAITISILTLIITASAILFTDSHILLKSLFGLGFILALVNLYRLLKK